MALRTPVFYWPFSHHPMNFMFKKRNCHSSCSPLELPSGYFSFWITCHRVNHPLTVKVCRHPTHFSFIQDCGTRLMVFFSGPELAICLSNNNIYSHDPSYPQWSSLLPLRPSISESQCGYAIISDECNAKSTFIIQRHARQTFLKHTWMSQSFILSTFFTSLLIKLKIYSFYLIMWFLPLWYSLHLDGRVTGLNVTRAHLCSLRLPQSCRVLPDRIS